MAFVEWFFYLTVSSLKMLKISVECCILNLRNLCFLCYIIPPLVEISKFVNRYKKNS